jgi:hypothetical protein
MEAQRLANQRQETSENVELWLALDAEVTKHDITWVCVRTVVIPRRGQPGQARQRVEHRPAFRGTIKWRTGCEGRISTLKRGYGWEPAMPTS